MYMYFVSEGFGYSQSKPCEIIIPIFVYFQSRSVDKRHAVFTYDQIEEKFKVKDLGSLNGVSVLS